jgi:hypothetical protein
MANRMIRLQVEDTKDRESRSIAMITFPIYIHPNVNLKIHSEHWAAYSVKKDGSIAG